MIKPHLGIFIAALVSAVMLAGCAPTPAPPVVAASPGDTATPTPTSTPTAAVITLNSDSTIITDQNGNTLATVDYFARGVDAAAILTAAFGFAPTVEVVAPRASDFGFQGTTYDWEGFTVYWMYGYEDDPASGVGEAPYTYRTSITATVASVRGITVQATDGVRVSDGQGDLSMLYPGTTVTFTDPDGMQIETARVNCVTLPPFPDDIGSEREGEPMNCVGVRAAPADGPVTSIHSPVNVNYGM